MSAPSIVVVGNGLIANPVPIDNFDIVIRLNTFQLAGYADLVGTKTTVWCYASNTWKRHRKNKYKNYVDHSYDEYEEIWTIKRSVISPAMRQQVIDRNCKYRIIPFAWDKELESLVRSWPSTGIFALYAAMKYYPDSLIHICGFSGIKAGGQHHYYNKGYAHVVHDSIKEKKLISTWISQGKVIPLIPQEFKGIRKVIKFL